MDKGFDLSYRETVIASAHQLNESDVFYHNQGPPTNDSLYSPQYGGRNTLSRPPNATSPYAGSPGWQDDRCPADPDNFDAQSMIARQHHMAHTQQQTDNHPARDRVGLILTPSAGPDNWGSRVK